MSQFKNNKKGLIFLLALIVLTGCNVPVDSSESSHSETSISSQAESSVDLSSENSEISSEVLSSENSEISSEVINSSSEEVSSQSSSESSIIDSSSEIPSSDSEDIPSSEESSSEPIPTIDFIDDVFLRSYNYEPNSYDIVEYEPTSNPYQSIDTVSEKNAFYNDNYQRASSYIDALYRSDMGLISGDIQDTGLSESYPLNHLPNRDNRQLSGYRLNEGVYEYNTDGSFKSYTINNLEGKVKKIYYGGGYVSLDDVAAYLFAFGKGPANYRSDKSSSAQKAIISSWGQYGRVNDAYYSSDVTSYKYEPSLPHTDNGGYRGEEMYNYHELDFGYTQTPWGYGIASNSPYNNGSSINRGTVRLVYTAETYDGDWGANYIPVDHRHVFLTFNHYNDFVEYLNYEGGWGIPFGWMSAGNDYVAGMNGSAYGPGYYDFVNPYPQTLYPEPQIKTLAQLKLLFNSL